MRPGLIVRAAVLSAAVLLLVGCTPERPPEPPRLASQRFGPPPPDRRVDITLVQHDGPVLVRIDSTDARLHSTVRDADGQMLSDIALDYLRSAPTWHVVDGSNPPYRLEIEVLQATREASLQVQQFALDTVTPADRARFQAWRQLARGLQHTEGESAEAWAENLTALDSAKQAFRRLGLVPEAMWAAYFKAYFEYYPLYRYTEALETAEDLIAQAGRMGLSDLQLLAYQLAGQIRIEREADADEQQARINYRRAREAFSHALELARRADNGFETIWALNNSGITLHYQDQPQQALRRYGEALDLALRLQDRYMIYLIGTNMAVANEKLGRIEGAIATLQRMLGSLDSTRQPHETEHVLNLLGLYYLKLYRFPEALDVLDRAIDLARQQGRTESLGRNRLLLAQAYRELGQHDKSALNLELAIPDLEASRNGRGLRRAWALGADLHRMQRDFGAMREDRARQQNYLATDADRAEWLAGRARDAEAEGRGDRAITLYRASAERFRATPFREYGQLAELRACVLATRIRQQPACSTAELAPAFAALTHTQASVPGLEARYLWGRLQALEGHAGEATETLRRLIVDMQFLRRTLPGVLGAWYWEARREIFDFYMELTLQSEPATDPSASLAALLWLLGTGNDAGQSAAGPAPAADTAAFAREARRLLAQRQRATTAAEAERAQRLIDQHLLANRPASVDVNRPLTAMDIDRQWRSMPVGWSVLTYYVSPRSVVAWTMGRDGLRRYDLGDSEGVSEELAALKDNLRVIHFPELQAELARWGSRLIAPLARNLGRQILFIGAGPFSDFPIETLIVDGDYLLRAHAVTNLVSGFDPAGTSRRLRAPLHPERLFLAGNPTALDPGQPELAGSVAELDVVERAFPAAAAVRLEGSDLSLERFTTEAFDAAGLVHIASHAVIDLTYPEFSSIRLSGRDELGAERLTPADLRGRRMQARLVVLSACSTVGLNRFEFDSDLGFVSTFLQTGGQQVLASLWPIPDRATVDLMRSFYAHARQAPDVASALRAAKLERIDTSGDLPGRWAAFQLFSR